MPAALDLLASCRAAVLLLSGQASCTAVCCRAWLLVLSKGSFAKNVLLQCFPKLFRERCCSPVCFCVQKYCRFLSWFSVARWVSWVQPSSGLPFCVETLAFTDFLAWTAACLSCGVWMPFSVSLCDQWRAVLCSEFLSFLKGVTVVSF